MTQADWLEAIKRTGSRDTVLQFADWLEERGDTLTASRLRQVDPGEMLFHDVTMILASRAAVESVANAGLAIRTLGDAFAMAMQGPMEAIAEAASAFASLDLSPPDSALLIEADWLEEHGAIHRPRLMRLMVEAERVWDELGWQVEQITFEVTSETSLVNTAIGVVESTQPAYHIHFLLQDHTTLPRELASQMQEVSTDDPLHQRAMRLAFIRSYLTGWRPSVRITP